jgi:hypothetical protein
VWLCCTALQLPGLEESVRTKRSELTGLDKELTRKASASGRAAPSGPYRGGGAVREMLGAVEVQSGGDLVQHILCALEVLCKARDQVQHIKCALDMLCRGRDQTGLCTVCLIAPQNLPQLTDGVGGSNWECNLNTQKSECAICDWMHSVRPEKVFM